MTFRLVKRISYECLHSLYLLGSKLKLCGQVWREAYESSSAADDEEETTRRHHAAAVTTATDTTTEDGCFTKHKTT